MEISSGHVIFFIFSSNHVFLAISLPVAASQMRAVLSSEAVTMRVPSGLKAADSMPMWLSTAILKSSDVVVPRGRAGPRHQCDERRASHGEGQCEACAQGRMLDEVAQGRVELRAWIAGAKSSSRQISVGAITSMPSVSAATLTVTVSQAAVG